MIAPNSSWQRSLELRKFRDDLEEALRLLVAAETLTHDALAAAGLIGLTDGIHTLSPYRVAAFEALHRIYAHESAAYAATVVRNT